MRPADDIKQLIDAARMRSSARIDRRILGDALADLEKRRADRLTHRPGVRRFLMRNPMKKLAAAAVILVAVLAGLHQFGGTSATFAAVVEPFFTARTATFEYTVAVENGPSQTGKGMFMEPGRIRQETPRGTIVIADLQRGRMVASIPAQRRAIVYELKDLSQESGELNLFLEIRRRIREARQLGDESVQSLGEQEVESRAALGYRVQKAGTSITVWADAESLLPVRVESTTGHTTYTMSHIVFDVALDESLFRTEVPSGYAVSTLEVDGSEPEEKDLIEMFRLWARHMDGTFPSTLGPSAPAEFMDAQREKIKAGGREPSPQDVLEMQQIIMKMSRGASFVQQLPPDSDWHYAGKDAVLGEATTAIFWYHPPGSATYRVVYADLFIRDVALEDLPQ